MVPKDRRIFHSKVTVNPGEGKKLGSFTIDDRNSDDNAKNYEFDWSSEENKRAARAARTYEQVRAVLCKITT